MVLTGSDGNELSAAYAAPVATAKVGVVVLPDVRGLHPYYVALVERFAEAGLPAVAIDYFGRTAGLADAGTREDDFAFREHVERAEPAGVDADIAAGIDSLRSRTQPALPVVTVGFCFGGSHSWRQSGGQLDVAGCVGFYGRPGVVGDAASRAVKPTVMIIAGTDRVTPVAEQQQLAATMRRAGADVDEVVYEGAPHSFFDRAFGDWADACQDAWRHVLALTDRVALS